MKKVIIIPLSLLSVFFLSITTSCNRTNNNHKALLAHVWVLESIIDHDREAVISVPDDVFLMFADSNRVHGNAGCNNFNGHYETVAYDQIGMRQLATTQMWCFNMDFETDYLGRLEKVVSYEAAPDKLELTGPGNTFTLVYLPRGGATYSTR